MVSSGLQGVRRPARGQAVYLLVGVGLLLGYAVLATLLWINRDFADDGPLSFHRPAASVALDPGKSLESVQKECVDVGDFSLGSKDRVKVIAARIDGAAYYACYQISNGSVFAATVIDADGFKAPNRIIKKGGAWPWIGVVKKPNELILGGFALAALLALYFQYYRRERPGPPIPARWWQTSGCSALLGVFMVLPFTLPFRRRESRGRRVRLLYLFVFGLTAAILVTLLLTSLDDRTSAVVLGLLNAGMLFGWLGGWTLIRPPGFGAPDLVAFRPPEWSGQGVGPAGQVEQVQAPQQFGQLALPREAGAPESPRSAPVAVSARRRGSSSALSPNVRPPTGLPNFAALGGMQKVKDELSDTFGLLLAFGDEADVYRITFNGVLLHGPPGVGKTFIAKAAAGEFGLNFAQISTANLLSKYIGESAQNIKAVFAEAARSVPCLLFFDEFDSIAERRDSDLNEESKRVVNQLLQSLEEWRPVRDLIIVAATNHLDRLDPAVIRAGRFDRHIRVDLPDLAARRAILAAQLAGRPLDDDVDLDDLAERTEGRTPATIARVVEAAAMAAFRTATSSGVSEPIRQQNLRDALAGLGGTDRPTIEDWNWDRLVLPETMKAEMRQLQALVADPDLAKAYGVDVPSGLLLAGPPGTGKTTVARVLAAQAGFSFYPLTAADLTSKWVGESEASVARLFARARDNAPSIIFIDEIDAIAGTRSDTGSYLDRTLTQLLSEIDGISKARGVFVVAATNRPDMLDPALLRGGRLSRTITIPLPDVADRLRLLDLFCRRMPLRDVDLDALAKRTTGFAGADLQALCQQAALNAMLAAQRSTETGEPSAVTPAAFAEALRNLAKTGKAPAAWRDDSLEAGGYL